ncbi:MAG: NrfD/PsrC family molybdoenzyme membrane anchor subunit [Deltaproteobacteria bacterium]|nr:NrfD/PsrC family molybdoenzyme membrane anchor subunit [Deltaproteobacteria bacterium]
MLSGHKDTLDPRPFIEGEQTDKSLNDSLLHHVLRGAGKGWWTLFTIALCLLSVLGVSLGWTLYKGIGAWGNNQPVSWGFGIINFVWWIGIGHAGTLISAILLLFQQRWRTSINRFAEAMTLFAVMCALIFPVMHTGRPWYAIYFLMPYPSVNAIWPQFKSPLMWDVFAVSTYFTISLLFWFLGLVPDLASLRDSAKSKTKKFVYGLFALGWRGSGRHWAEYKWAYLLLAGLSTPLVLSVHSIVSFDFAVSVMPGWHTTIFPPYFVAGAIFSGFAMVITWLVPARHYLGLKHVVTMRHLENMNKVILATGMMVTYGYAMEHFIAWYSGSPYEFGMFFHTRQRGPASGIYWLMVFCNCVAPQFYWFKSLRTNLKFMWIVSIFVNIGMWCERFIIVVTSLHQDYLPSSWGDFSPTVTDVGLYIGTIGLFSTLFLLFMKFIPAVALTEIKELRHELEHEAHAEQGGHAAGGAH